VTLLVDTSVWSLALRRDRPSDDAEVAVLRDALEHGHTVVSTGLVLQELLQGVVPDRARAQVASRFAALPMVQPTVADHVAAAELRNRCRARGVQLGTVGAVIAQLAIRHRLTVLSTDRDFERAARVVDLNVWQPPNPSDV
jgi:predicted nucleic acid-binding protein